MKSMVCFLAGVLAGVLSMLCVSEKRSSDGGTDAVTRIDTLETCDTVRVPEPVVIGVRSRGSLSMRVPCVADSAEADSVRATARVRDSVTVELPVRQTVYGGDGYTAYVSGVAARLDSIEVRERTREIRTVSPPGRWHIGISGGYGMSGGRVQPYVGIGITYSLISIR